MKYNLSFKDKHGIGYAIESYKVDDDSGEGPERIYRIIEIESNSLQGQASVVVFESMLGELISSLIALERIAKSGDKQWIL